MKQTKEATIEKLSNFAWKRNLNKAISKNDSILKPIHGRNSEEKQSKTEAFKTKEKFPITETAGVSRKPGNGDHRNDHKQRNPEKENISGKQFNRNSQFNNRKFEFIEKRVKTNENLTDSQKQYRKLPNDGTNDREPNRTFVGKAVDEKQNQDFHMNSLNENLQRSNALKTQDIYYRVDFPNQSVKSAPNINANLFTRQNVETVTVNSPRHASEVNQSSDGYGITTGNFNDRFNRTELDSMVIPGAQNNENFIPNVKSSWNQFSNGNSLLNSPNTIQPLTDELMSNVTNFANLQNWNSNNMYNGNCFVETYTSPNVIPKDTSNYFDNLQHNSIVSAFDIEPNSQFNNRLSAGIENLNFHENLIWQNTINTDPSKSSCPPNSGFIFNTGIMDLSSTKVEPLKDSLPEFNEQQMKNILKIANLNINSSVELPINSNDRDENHVNVTASIVNQVIPKTPKPSLNLMKNYNKRLNVNEAEINSKIETVAKQLYVVSENVKNSETNGHFNIALFKKYKSKMELFSRISKIEENFPTQESNYNQGFSDKLNFNNEIVKNYNQVNPSDDPKFITRSDTAKHESTLNPKPYEQEYAPHACSNSRNNLHRNNFIGKTYQNESRLFNNQVKFSNKPNSMTIKVKNDCYVDFKRQGNQKSRPNISPNPPGILKKPNNWKVPKTEECVQFKKTAAKDAQISSTISRKKVSFCLEL